MENNSVDFNNLVWLHCDLQLRGKVIVRHGKRKEVATGEKWVFCPQQHFPRDRISIKICEKCKHFKGYSKIEVNQGKTTSKSIGKKLNDKKTWQMPKEDKQKKITITEEDVEMAIKKAKEEQRKWKEEEKKNTYSDKKNIG